MDCRIRDDEPYYEVHLECFFEPLAIQKARFFLGLSLYVNILQGP